MKHKRNGFTLIEIMLFLAVTALLMASVFGMTQNSIRQQRFNDSTQNFAEFLRSVYSQVANPQSIGDGRSDYAIYGKLITVGEKTDLGGNAISNQQAFFVYDVVGDSVGTGTGDAASMLSAVQANVVIINRVGSGYKAELAGMAERYVPTWDASIDTTTNGTAFKGSILIARHPRSGTITTLYYEQPIEVNYTLKNSSTNKNVMSVLLTSKLESFKLQEVDFCVNTEGYGKKSSQRWNVRLIKNARNASGVELVGLDSSDNRCKK
ncbi:type II secretion system protein [Candidatus Saccharibacteria bacterium]|nr:type II secretion system protein [Candidatus Saccharibacteria bacterium]